VRRTPRTRINEQIRAPQIRVIDETGKQLGVMTPAEAMRLARERELDLVEVASNAKPPVCRLIDYGKYQYEQTKRERQARKAQKQIEIKEVRLRPKTSEHDTDVRVRQARKFLESGAKVKVRLRFRGREIQHPQVALKILDDFAKRLADVGEVEIRPNMEGRSLLMILAPISKGKPASKGKPVKKSAPPKPAPKKQDAQPKPEKKG
jgi:translation initiation factor IF-3